MSLKIKCQVLQLHIYLESNKKKEIINFVKIMPCRYLLPGVSAEITIKLISTLAAINAIAIAVATFTASVNSFGRWAFWRRRGRGTKAAF